MTNAHTHSASSNVIPFPLDRARAARDSSAVPVSDTQIEQRETRRLLRAAHHARGVAVPAWLEPIDVDPLDAIIQHCDERARRLDPQGRTQTNFPR
jgi:hypothetical protein